MPCEPNLESKNSETPQSSCHSSFVAGAPGHILATDQTHLQNAHLSHLFTTVELLPTKFGFLSLWFAGFYISSDI
jgi:hypothetical protein